MVVNAATSGTVARPAEAPAPGGGAVVAPPKARRNPALVAASVLLIALGAVLGAWVYTSAGTAQEVVAVRTTVLRGETITRDDLTTVRISLDPALQPVSAASIADVVGKRAATDLSAGGLLVQGDVTDALVPGTGMSVVGISLTEGRLPAEPLLPGDTVRVVTTVSASGDTAKNPTAVDATVVETTALSTGDGYVVDVQVDTAAAPALAALAAAGDVALVLDSREG